MNDLERILRETEARKSAAKGHDPDAGSTPGVDPVKLESRIGTRGALAGYLNELSRFIAPESCR